MVKNQIKKLIIDNHRLFINKIKALSDEDFLKVANGKWTAGQQLDHILKSVNVVRAAFEVPKYVLKEKFGLSVKSSRSYERIVRDYLITLKQNPNYKLEKRFSPEKISLEIKIDKLEELENKVQNLFKGIENYSEVELDLYMLPHPVMGKFTLREILHFTAYHVQHHDQQILQNLKHED